MARMVRAVGRSHERPWLSLQSWLSRLNNRIDCLVIGATDNEKLKVYYGWLSIQRRTRPNVQQGQPPAV